MGPTTKSDISAEEKTKTLQGSEGAEEEGSSHAISLRSARKLIFSSFKPKHYGNKLEMLQLKLFLNIPNLSMHQ